MAAPDTGDNDNRAVAKNAGLAFLGRLGALIEVISLPIFGFLYGAATLGIFFTLWSIVRIATTLTEFAMTTSLQRFIPAADTGEETRRIMKIAVFFPLGLSTATALVLFVLAPVLSVHLNASEQDAAHLTNVIRLYVWILPFWTLVEVLTSSVRAQRKFGPEIRVRIFYEQIMRIIAAIAFYYLGFATFGLFMAHVLSVSVAAWLAYRLAGRFYNFMDVCRAPWDADTFRKMSRFAVMMAPANLIKRLKSELPVLLLNLILPGAQGANAAALYGVARRIASVLQVVRQSFEYVVAPMASFHQARTSKKELENMYAFATRLIMAIIIPFGILLLAVRKDFFAVLFAEEFQAAGGALLVLAIGKVAESFAGPSSAMVEMLGHRTLPLLNSTAGIVLMVVLTFLLAPGMGATGAAIGAAAGLNLNAYLALFETLFVFKIMPYRMSLIRPLLVTATATVIMAAIIHFSRELGEGGRLAMAPVASIIALFILVRYGLEREDADALGRIGRWLRPKKPKEAHRVKT